MIPRGIKASELIKILKELIELYGDLQVFTSGRDYPSGVDEAFYVKPESGNAYIPGNSFLVD